MDVVRTLIVATLAVVMIRTSDRLSYDPGHGVRLAAVAERGRA